MALVTQLLPDDQVGRVHLRSTVEHYCEGLRSSLEAAQKSSSSVFLLDMLPELHVRNLVN